VRAWLRAIAGVLSALCAATARAEEGAPELPPAPPIAWQDTGPFAQLFLQFPFEGPDTLPPGVLAVGLRTLYSNSIAREQGPELSVDVSVESAVPTAFVRYGLPLGLELQLALPGAIEYGGFLGRPIKFVEGLFGPVNPLRAGRPPATARFRMVRRDGSGIDWSGDGARAGDPWIGLKRRIRRQDEWRPALAWRAALELPTAPVPLGSGLFEAGVGLLAGWTAGATALIVEADAMIPQLRPFTSAGLTPQPHFALQLASVTRLSSWLSGTVQASAHTSAIAGTGIFSVEGTTTYLLAGLVMEPTRRTSISFAVAENVIHPSRGADISAVLELAWRR
jgi:hypothetical protein